jgi:hypothetical protein
MKKKFVGWIFIEREEGFKDYFSIHVTRDGLPPLVRVMGRGEHGAAASVAFFEDSEATVHDSSTGTNQLVDGLNLGPVKLEQTPLGLRVFVEEYEEVA